jgi:hypothetical protein
VASGLVEAFNGEGGSGLGCGFVEGLTRIGPVWSVCFGFFGLGVGFVLGPAYVFIFQQVDF